MTRAKAREHDHAIVQGKCSRSTRAVYYVSNTDLIERTSATPLSRPVCNRTGRTWAIAASPCLP